MLGKSQERRPRADTISNCDQKEAAKARYRYFEGLEVDKLPPIRDRTCSIGNNKQNPKEPEKDLNQDMPISPVNSKSSNSSESSIHPSPNRAPSPIPFSDSFLIL